ncbi:uncharacterized membrane-associated protein [Longilinea arvoryzae]|uniref:Uncharacterized membrane-associated protein n=1 Tax=Longilinea arvoryzae TaxID=360412 RepID=A0A0S7BN07_9CHLR|nr:VTT domain-containing protein [Longilinea arvoryzae]GAP15688.1 uncharacterized membrane-associated protein [Longilinea arvoryzae]
MAFEILQLSSFGLLPYCILGLLVMAEGPFATLLGGAASSNGILLPVPAYFSVVVGNLTADMGWYLLGRFSKMQWLLRVAPRLGIKPQTIDQLRLGIQRNAPRLLFLAKLSVGLPIPTLVATGLSRVPVRRWAGMLVLGELLKSAALVSVGYLYAQAIEQASAGVRMVLWAMTAILVVAGLVWYRTRKNKARK